VYRVAAITGGAGAIGGAIATSLRDAGHAVAILDREAEFAVDLGSEAAVRAVANQVLERMGRCDVTVNCVAPGLTRTPAAEAGMPEAAFEQVRAQQALPRTLVAEDVSGVVAFLASDAAAAITGQTLCADGGLVLR